MPTKKKTTYLPYPNTIIPTFAFYGPPKMHAERADLKMYEGGFNSKQSLINPT